MKKAFISAAILGVSMPVLALDPVGDEKGWSGFVNPGGGFGSIETNLLSEVQGFDLGDERVTDPGSPDDEDIALPSGGFEVGYNFDNGKTRVLLNNAVLDITNVELAFQVAVRHDFGNIGTMQLAGLTTAGSSIKAYQDPYQVGVSRQDTDMDSGGARFTWDKMFGSNY